jgi:hypothetical protein
VLQLVLYAIVAAGLIGGIAFHVLKRSAWAVRRERVDVRTAAGPSRRVRLHAGAASRAELPAGKPTEHLRAILVATGTLPPRDEHLARLERWVARILAERDGPGQRQLLHRYAVWHLLRRLRQRNNGRYATYSQLVTVKRHVSAAIALPGGLGTRGRALADARQADLDTWLTSDQARYRRDAGHFVRWAQRKKLTSLEFPAARWHGPARTIDTEARWAQARWLLHDHAVHPVDRVAGLLVLLYAQTRPQSAASPSNMSRPPNVRCAFGWAASPSRCPSHSPPWSPASSPGAPGTPRLVTRQPRPGCSPAAAPANRSAPTSSQSECADSGYAPLRAAPPHCSASPPNSPAAVLARLLGIHIKVAVAWQQACAGDWTRYAADYSRRTPTPAQDAEPALRHAGG